MDSPPTLQHPVVGVSVDCVSSIVALTGEPNAEVILELCWQGEDYRTEARPAGEIQEGGYSGELLVRAAKAGGEENIKGSLYRKREEGDNEVIGTFEIPVPSVGKGHQNVTVALNGSVAGDGARAEVTFSVRQMPLARKGNKVVYQPGQPIASSSGSQLSHPGSPSALHSPSSPAVVISMCNESDQANDKRISIAVGKDLEDVGVRRPSPSPRLRRQMGGRRSPMVEFETEFLGNAVENTADGGENTVGNGEDTDANEVREGGREEGMNEDDIARMIEEMGAMPLCGTVGNTLDGDFADGGFGNLPVGGVLSSTNPSSMMVGAASPSAPPLFPTGPGQGLGFFASSTFAPSSALTSAVSPRLQLNFSHENGPLTPHPAGNDLRAVSLPDQEETPSEISTLDPPPPLPTGTVRSPPTADVDPIHAPPPPPGEFPNGDASFDSITMGPRGPTPDHFMQLFAQITANGSPLPRAEHQSKLQEGDDSTPPPLPDGQMSRQPLACMDAPAVASVPDADGAIGNFPVSEGGPTTDDFRQLFVQVGAASEGISREQHQSKFAELENGPPPLPNGHVSGPPLHHAAGPIVAPTTQDCTAVTLGQYSLGPGGPTVDNFRQLFSDISAMRRDESDPQHQSKSAEQEDGMPPPLPHGTVTRDSAHEPAPVTAPITGPDHTAGHPIGQFPLGRGGPTPSDFARLLDELAARQPPPSTQDPSKQPHSDNAPPPLLTGSIQATFQAPTTQLDALQAPPLAPSNFPTPEDVGFFTGRGGSTTFDFERLFEQMRNAPDGPFGQQHPSKLMQSVPDPATMAGPPGIPLLAPPENADIPWTEEGVRLHRGKTLTEPPTGLSTFAATDNIGSHQGSHYATLSQSPAHFSNYLHSRYQSAHSPDTTSTDNRERQALTDATTSPESLVEPEPTRMSLGRATSGHSPSMVDLLGRLAAETDRVSGPADLHMNDSQPIESPGERPYRGSATTAGFMGGEVEGTRQQNGRLFGLWPMQVEADRQSHDVIQMQPITASNADLFDLDLASVDLPDELRTDDDGDSSIVLRPLDIGNLMFDIDSSHAMPPIEEEVGDPAEDDIIELERGYVGVLGAMGTVEGAVWVMETLGGMAQSLNEPLEDEPPTHAPVLELLRTTLASAATTLGLSPTTITTTTPPTQEHTDPPLQEHAAPPPARPTRRRAATGPARTTKRFSWQPQVPGPRRKTALGIATDDFSREIWSDERKRLLRQTCDGLTKAEREAFYAQMELMDAIEGQEELREVLAQARQAYMAERRQSAVLHVQAQEVSSMLAGMEDTEAGRAVGDLQGIVQAGMHMVGEGAPQQAGHVLPLPPDVVRLTWLGKVGTDPYEQRAVASAVQGAGSEGQRLGILSHLEMMKQVHEATENIRELHTVRTAHEQLSKHRARLEGSLTHCKAYLDTVKGEGVKGRAATQAGASERPGGAAGALQNVRDTVRFLIFGNY